MTTTRRVLLAANTQLQAQLTACEPESRKQLKAKLAAARDEAKSLRAERDKLTKALHERIVNDANAIAAAEAAGA